ncbi:transmembrane protein 44 isoform X3 [Accipiter gentilis]|uniref:transmembrane protein 44 isoform X3 n=1 Tax=Astur gentilis TaxID=8957 RepID=UPI002110970B|nr:transmembrane protein 44 isoform X3 [Accipiter gentilis]XP_049658467.1 transmembrane protein 44 isoform X3 [Accipiter gentilis]
MLGMLAMGHSDSAAWPAACLAGEPSCVSWGLWMLAALCWIAARSLLSCECPGKGHRQPSVLCLLYSSLGHICNTVGALLASQLGIQILTGAYMAVADVVRFLLTLFPPCPPESRKTAGLPRRRRRWQRLRGGLLALTLPLSVGAGRSLLVPGPRPSRGQLKGAWRRLLGAVFEDNREALGFVLGLLSAFVALTARIPALLRAAVNWAPLNMFPKPRSGPRMVTTSHCLDLMIRLVQQTGHSVARLPRDAQMGAAGPVPPQPPACPPVPALCAGLSSSSSSDAASVNLELEWDFEDATVQWSQPSPAAQPCTVLCPGTFGQPAAPPRCPEPPSPWLSKQ